MGRTHDCAGTQWHWLSPRFTLSLPFSCKHHIGLEEFVDRGGMPGHLRVEAALSGTTTYKSNRDKPEDKRSLSGFLRMSGAGTAFDAQPAVDAGAAGAAGAGAGAGSGAGAGAGSTTSTGAKPSVADTAAGSDRLESIPREVLDIEELATYGKQASVCRARR